MVKAEKVKILVIEDDEILRQMLGRILCHAGHEVVEAGNGAEALGHIQHDPIDLVITDLIMPEMEGIETIRKLRERNANLPIIAISGGGRIGPQHYLEAAKRLGANHVLPKPFSMEAILGAVRQVARGDSGSDDNPLDRSSSPSSRVESQSPDSIDAQFQHRLNL